MPRIIPNKFKRYLRNKQVFITINTSEILTEIGVILQNIMSKLPMTVLHIQGKIRVYFKMQRIIKWRDKTIC